MHKEETMTDAPERSIKRNSFSFSQVEGALCAWEWMLDNQSHPKLDEWHDALGSQGMRMLAMQAGDICDRVYKHMESLGFEFSDVYDFEFVPAVCSKLHWDALAKDNQYNDGRYDPDVNEILLAMIAADKAANTDPSRRSFHTASLTLDQFSFLCRAEAEKQWGYADLVADHADRVRSAWVEDQEPAEFIKWLGEKYDLTPKQEMGLAS